MKHTLTLILSIFTLSAFSQRPDVRLGAAASFFNKSSIGTGYGAEVAVGKRWGAFSGSLGAQLVNTTHNGVYAPITVSLGASLGPVTFHVDPGILLHDIQVRDKTWERGRNYYGGGVRMTGEDGIYINLQYGEYHTRVDGASTTSTSAVGFSIGYQFGAKK
jgi:hypothetical protein